VSEMVATAKARTCDDRKFDSCGLVENEIGDFADLLAGQPR